MTGALLAPTGWLLAVIAAAWLSSPLTREDALPPTLLALAAAGALYAGTLLPRRLVPAFGAATGCTVAVVVVTATDGLSGAPLAGPLGYANANGALCAQGAAAAMVPVVASRSVPLRAASALVAGLLVVLAAETGSAAGLAAAAACVLLPVLPLVAGRRHRARACRVVGTAVVVAVTAGLATTVALAAAYEPESARAAGIDRFVDDTLTERRVALWSEALDLLARNPADGVGAGRFDETSPTALDDADARWAHSGYLQYAAETGLPGLAALLGLTAWAFLTVWRTCHDVLPLVGACAIGALVGHAAIDYVLHFPAVPLLALATSGICLRPDGARARTAAP